MTTRLDRVPEREPGKLCLRVERYDRLTHAIEPRGRDLEIQRVKGDRIGGALHLHIDKGAAGKRERAGIGSTLMS
jgi:hypothetical protein